MSVAPLVIGYVRVSTIEQEGGYGPEVQRSHILAYCERNKLGAPEIIEESASAESLSGRKELLGILARAQREQEAGTQVHIVFRSSDRLARELMDQEGVVANAFAKGYRLHSTLPHEADLFDPAYAGDPMRRAIRQFFGIFNQLDKAIIQQRLDGGLYTKAAQGGSTGGRYPFGYRGVNGDITIDPLEAPAVNLVFSAHAKGLDLASIAAVAAQTYPEMCRHWSKAQVKRILDRRDLYCGGMYRSRLAIQPTHHPELVIVRSDYEHVAPTTVDLESLPDPCALSAASLCLGESPAHLQRILSEQRLPVLHRGTRLLLPRPTLRILAQEVMSQKSGT
jgi:DNA invertase Pin-like site-specific DNA recombinase